MAITYASNIASLRAANALSKHNQALGVNFQRLSSGLRINSAADDPAALHVSQQLAADARVASVAIRNANDGISYISINETALSEIVNVLSRMAELASQAANGIYYNVQRSGLQMEFAALGSEIERIARVANFNDINTLSAGQEIVMQVGFDAYSSSQIQIDAVQATLSALSLADSGSSTLVYSILANSESGSIAAAVTALAAVTTALELATVKRGQLGASMDRLEVAVNNLQVVRENYSAALGRITDIDVAQEVAEMTRNTILRDATTAVLAQANVQPSLALQLLQPD